METKKVLGIVFSVLFIGVFAFVLSWGIINFNKVKDGISGTGVYTKEDIDNAYKDGYNTALENKEEYDILLDDYRDKITILTDSVSSLNSEIITLTNNNNDYKSEITRLTNLTIQNEQTINDLNMVIEQKNSTILSLQDEINLLNVDKTNLTTQVNLLNNELNNKQLIIDSLNNQLTDLNNDISAKRSQILSLQNEIVTLEEEIATLNEQLITAGNENTTLVGKLERTQASLDEANAELEESASFITKWQNKYVEVLTEKEELTSQIETLTIQKNNYERDIINLNNQIVSLQNEIEVLNSDKNSLSDSISSLFNKNIELNNEIDELNATITEKDNFINQLQIQISNLNTELLYCKNLINQLSVEELHTVTFYYMDAVYSVQFVKDNAFVNVTNPSDERFAGWTLNGEVVDLSTLAITEDISIYAKLLNEYTVTVYDGVVAMMSTPSVLKTYTLVEGQNLSKLNILNDNDLKIYSGYSINAYVTKASAFSSEVAIDVSNYEVNSNLSIYTKWSQNGDDLMYIGNKYTIIANPNHEIKSLSVLSRYGTQKFEFTAEDVASFYLAEKSYYQTTLDYTENVNGYDLDIHYIIRFAWNNSYGYWDFYEVEFSEYYGEIKMDANYSTTAVTLQVYAPKGANALWSTNKLVNYVAPAVPTLFTVTFVVDGEICETKKISSKVNSVKTILPSEPIKDNYTFTGWSIDGETVIDTSTYKVTADITLTAIFEEIV